MGPLELDWESFVRLRLNEQLLHEWDVAVALEPSATLPDDGTEIVVDNLELIGRWTAKASGEPRTITVATTNPDRAFQIGIAPDGVTFGPAESGAGADLVLPSEAFVRLVYGRLDTDHPATSVSGDSALLEQLRAVFPGP
jgi:hypothetical protein